MKLPFTVLMIMGALAVAVPNVVCQNSAMTDQVVWRASHFEPIPMNSERAYDITQPVLPQEFGWMGNRMQLTFDLPRFFRPGEQFLFTFNVTYVARAETGPHKGEFPKVTFYGQTPQGFFVKLGKTLVIDHPGRYEIPVSKSILQEGGKNLIDVRAENIDPRDLGYGKKPACFVWHEMALVNRS